jgi:protein TonB
MPNIFMGKSIGGRKSRQAPKIAAMPLYFHLLFSLALHLALILGPHWLKVPPPPPPPNRLEVYLPTPPELPPTEQSAEITSTEVPPPAPPPPPAAAPPPVVAPPAPSPPVPKKLQGAALRKAQSALSSHLLYPPEAIRLGLEGDVILLLRLDGSGNIRSVAIARSSGHALLDQAAISAAGNIGALPGNKAETLLPVSFRLQ